MATITWRLSVSAARSHGPTYDGNADCERPMSRRMAVRAGSNRLGCEDRRTMLDPEADLAKHALSDPTNSGG